MNNNQRIAEIENGKMDANDICANLMDFAVMLDRQDMFTDGDACMEAINLINSLETQLLESQRRADAAVEDMKRINGLDMRSELEMCRFCKFGVDKHCRKCDFGKMTNNFEWRGAQAREGDAE